jgi:hypothetical protein
MTKLTKINSHVYTAPASAKTGHAEAAKAMEAEAAHVKQLDVQQLYSVHLDVGGPGYVICPPTGIAAGTVSYVEAKRLWHWPDDQICVHQGGTNVYVPKRDGILESVFVKSGPTSTATVDRFDTPQLAHMAILEKKTSGVPKFLAHLTDDRWATISHP